MDVYRPKQKSPVENFYLAGSYTYQVCVCVCGWLWWGFGDGWIDGDACCGVGGGSPVVRNAHSTSHLPRVPVCSCATTTTGLHRLHGGRHQVGALVRGPNPEVGTCQSFVTQRCELGSRGLHAWLRASITNLFGYRFVLHACGFRQSLNVIPRTCSDYHNRDAKEIKARAGKAKEVLNA